MRVCRQSTSPETLSEVISFWALFGIVQGDLESQGAYSKKGAARSLALCGTQLIFDVLYEALGAGGFELSLRDVSAPICVDLREVDNERCRG
jgi:hypothetical protein